jgi:membrane protease YdiL (CAAX protease family)
VRRFDQQRFDLRTAGFTPNRQARRQPYPWRLALVVAAGAVVALVLTNASAASHSSFGPAHKVGIGVALGELLIRYPLTVLAEEGLFRGVLQPRLGRYGPVLSAVLWGSYHLQQAATIPSLILFGLLLGFFRWQQGDVRLTAALHYAGDAIFFITGYM